MKWNTYQIGSFCPPCESFSLVLQLTENCPWAKCKYCTLYQNKKFRIRSTTSIKNDIDTIAHYCYRILSHVTNDILDIDATQKEYLTLETDEQRLCYDTVFLWITKGNCESIFLQDGDSLVLPHESLIEILDYIRFRFPSIKRITSYSCAKTLAKISSEHYKELHHAGLSRIYSGYESGSDQVLELVNKGSTQKDEIIGGRKVKEAGIELSIYIMPGLGGLALSAENARENARMINETNPDFVRLRTFILQKGSGMEELTITENYKELKDIEKLKEIRMMLDYINPHLATGMLLSDHMINLLQNVEGSMNTDLPFMKSYIDEFLALPPQEQRFYQLARRIGFTHDWKETDRLPLKNQEEINRIIHITSSDLEWEHLLTDCVDKYTKNM